jgi:pimeloyl-ACP methyl ester carboxylesterase
MSADRSTALREVLGHDLFGSGASHVVVLNDWLCDTSTWDGARDYLDTARFTFAFTDLRGYGRSRGRTGSFTIAEAAADVLALGDALQWPSFAVVGHSMSTLIALHLAQHHADRIARVVLLTPPPPMGFGADDATIAASRALAEGDAATQLAGMKARASSRLSER